MRSGLTYIIVNPIFSGKNVLLEIILRSGATGFGARIVTALWRSVQAYHL